MEFQQSVCDDEHETQPSSDFAHTPVAEHMTMPVGHVSTHAPAATWQRFAGHASEPKLLHAGALHVREAVSHTHDTVAPVVEPGSATFCTQFVESRSAHAVGVIVLSVVVVVVVTGRAPQVDCAKSHKQPSAVAQSLASRYVTHWRMHRPLGVYVHALASHARCEHDEQPSFGVGKQPWNAASDWRHCVDVRSKHGSEAHTLCVSCQKHGAAARLHASAVFASAQDAARGTSALTHVLAVAFHVHALSVPHAPALRHAPHLATQTDVSWLNQHFSFAAHAAASVMPRQSGCSKQLT